MKKFKMIYRRTCDIEDQMMIIEAKEQDTAKQLLCTALAIPYISALDWLHWEELPEDRYLTYEEIDELIEDEKKVAEEWGQLPRRADENAHVLDAYQNILNDRVLFIHNLGWLLSQTREDVESCRLDHISPDEEYVIISYGSGYKRRVNISLDSYAAIIRDVMKAL